MPTAPPTQSLSPIMPRTSAFTHAGCSQSGVVSVFVSASTCDKFCYISMQRWLSGLNLAFHSGTEFHICCRTSLHKASSQSDRQLTCSPLGSLQQGMVAQDSGMALPGPVLTVSRLWTSCSKKCLCISSMHYGLHRAGTSA